MLKLNINANIGLPVNGKIKMDIPDFAKYKANLNSLIKKCNPYQKYKNIIIIGNGGSVTSFDAMYTALAKYSTKKNVEILNTMEPDYLLYVKNKFKKTETLVIAISKSGNTVGVLENVLFFKDYPTLIITSNNTGALKQYADKQKIDTIEHPEIGGRYSGLTPTGLVPAILFNIDVKKIQSAALKMYKKCAPDSKKNPALLLSNILYKLDKLSFSEIFMPVYSTRLQGFITLIMQLIHESSGKEHKGQTIYGALAPESQHHTNQRFFGGKRNVVGLFLKTAKPTKDQILKVPKNLQDIKIRDGSLKNLNNLSLAKALEFEYLGTMKDAKNNKIPNITLELDKISPESIGELMALCHYIGVYSSYLRKVNPFDQPQVESSKKISFGLVKRYSRK